MKFFSQLLGEPKSEGEREMKGVAKDSAENRGKAFAGGEKGKMEGEDAGARWRGVGKGIKVTK